MNNRRLLVALVTAALPFAFGKQLEAQALTTGAISGTVTNEAGIPIEGAQVRVLNRSTGAAVGAITRVNGLYTVAGLEIGGPYSVTARSIGYRQAVNDDITVSLGATSRSDFKLLSQAISLTAVTVTGTTESSVISPTKTGISTSISDSALRRLPSLNRNFTDFVALVPQVTTTLPNGAISGGGVNNRFNQIQIDGSSETDLFGLGSTGQPGGQAGGKSIAIESVKEYQILLSPFDVRQGNFAGLLVNAVTKSGTNDMHGSAYYFGRNASLTRSQPYITDYTQKQYGFSIGGPIVHDKVFFFMNPEWQQQSQPASGFFLGAAGSNLTQATVDRFSSDLNAVGIAPGSAGRVTNQHPLTNFFGRMDFHLPWNTTLVLRDNYGYAVQDVFSRGSSGTAPSFPLTSNAFQFRSKKNNIGGQLRTNFSNGAFNEFLVGSTAIRDVRLPAVATPMVTAFVPGQASLVAGAERFSHGNALDQDITELTDNFTIPVGEHNYTVGLQSTTYRVRNLFAQSTHGVWNFGSLDSLEAGLANQYIVGVPITGDGAVRFRARTYAAYAEDIWNVTNRFTFTYGLRLDIPKFADRPPTNPLILSQFGRNTNDIPNGHVQWSPRFGFNWDVTGDQRNQLRGGVGSFTGHPAYVWLSNAFQNSGLTGVALLTCTRAAKDAIPAFNSATVGSPPSACGAKTAALGGEIDLLNSNLRFPQDARASLGFDHALGTNGLVATFEGLYTHAIYAPFYQNIALKGIQGFDVNGRTMYGPRPFVDSLKVPGRTAVIDVSNSNKDYSFSLTAGLQRRFLNNWSGSAFYTYSYARDVQSLGSSTAISNYQFGRRTAGNEAVQNLTRSDFDQPHRIVVQGTRTFFTNTDLSLIYIGASGTPYDYVYSSDLNADGFSFNDPIYVPTDATDPNQIKFADITSGGTTTFTAAQEAAAFNDFINSTPCLREQRGHIMTRNTCRQPWSNLVNLSLRQSLPMFRANRASVQLDVINFLNLVNKNWGHQAFTFSDVTLLSFRNLSSSTGTLIRNQPTTTTPVFQFTPGQPKFDFNNIASNYQMQLSFRYSF